MPDSAIDEAVTQAVTRALATVPREHYTDHPRWGRLPLPIPADDVRRELCGVGLRPGARVLEVGTGSGYTGALLAALVGSDGLVVSVDIAPDRVERASALHAERGLSGVLLAAMDGHLGMPEHRPYDAVVAWASPTEIPAAWVGQSRPGAVICSPVYLAPVAGAIGWLRASVSPDGQLVGPRLAPAAHTDLSPGAGPDGVPTDPSDLPAHYVDATRELAGGGTAWVSTAWRGQYPGHDPAMTLAMLTDPDHVESVTLTVPAAPADLADPADTAEPAGTVDAAAVTQRAWRDFRAYCTGRDPSNLTTFGRTRGPGTPGVLAVGFSSGLNAAALTSAGTLIANGLDSPALAKVREYFTEWEKAGRPGVDTLRPVLRATETGWQVRTTPMRLARRRPVG